jgi:hypothetical protein
MIIGKNPPAIKTYQYQVINPNDEKVTPKPLMQKANNTNKESIKINIISSFRLMHW